MTIYPTLEEVEAVLTEVNGSPVGTWSWFETKLAREIIRLRSTSPAPLPEAVEQAGGEQFRKALDRLIEAVRNEWRITSDGQSNANDQDVALAELNAARAALLAPVPTETEAVEGGREVVECRVLEGGILWLPDDYWPIGTWARVERLPEKDNG